MTGALETSRALFYKGQISEPLFTLDPDGQISTGENDTVPSFFQEYKLKLEKIYDKFYTEHGKHLAQQHRQAAVDFYEHVLAEASCAYRLVKAELAKHIE